MNESRFDADRSAAIRSILIQTVEAEPARTRRAHLRIAIATILAALGLTLGGTAVAVALSGGSLFTVGAPAPATTSSSPAPSPSVTSTVTPTPTASPHPLAITGDRIVPHDIVSAPESSPRWSIDLPTLGDNPPGCTYDRVIDVSDGYAIVQRSLLAANASPEFCDVSANRLSVALVDTAAGTIVWNRDWSWDPMQTDSTDARLLGTSGRVLIWDPSAGPGPAEVLDLATGKTLGPVVAPDGFLVSELNAVPGDSGDVIFTAPRLGADGQPTTSWSTMRADPLALASPRWSYDLTANQVFNFPIGNSSSVLNVTYLRNDSGWAADVIDADTGAVMTAGVAERSYIYFDGFTLRETGFNSYGTPTAIAGIDDAGNEFWSRESGSGIGIGRVDRAGQKPGAVALNDSTDVAVFSSSTQLELVDGLTGQTKWVADATACGVDPASFNRSAAEFTLQPDGVLVDVYSGCAFDYATGAAADVGGRRDAGRLGSAVAYELSGGSASSGRSVFEEVIPDSGKASAFDALSGAELWTIPIASDERWESAGGYVIGFSDGRIFGIG